MEPHSYEMIDSFMQFLMFILSGTGCYNLYLPGNFVNRFIERRM